MPVEDLLTMKSHDAQYYYDVLDGVTVADALQRKEIDDEYHQRIVKVMARERINLVPVLIINDTVYNGHRRIMMAETLGLEEMLCTDDWYDSGWQHEDTVIGETDERIGLLA